MSTPTPPAGFTVVPTMKTYTLARYVTSGDDTACTNCGWEYIVTQHAQRQDDGAWTMLWMCACGSDWGP